MEEAKCMTTPVEQSIPAQTIDLMNDVYDSPVVMKQSEIKEDENNNNNLLMESMSIPRSRLSTVPQPVMEMSVQTEEQKMESMIQPFSVKPVSAQPANVNKEKSDKKMVLESVTLVESQVAIEPKPGRKSNQTQN